MNEPLEFQGYYLETIIYFEENYDEPLTNTLFIPDGTLSHEAVKATIKKRGQVYNNPPVLARIHIYNVWGEDWDYVDHDRVIELNDKQCKHIWIWY